MQTAGQWSWFTNAWRSSHSVSGNVSSSGGVLLELSPVLEGADVNTVTPPGSHPDLLEASDPEELVEEDLLMGGVQEPPAFLDTEES